jgi:hypothetical protein
VAEKASQRGRLDALAIVKPATVIEWHRRGFARFWVCRGNFPIARLVEAHETMTSRSKVPSRVPAFAPDLDEVNASRDLAFVAWQVELKVRRFASRHRQRPKRRGGRTWTTWSAEDIYGA